MNLMYEEPVIRKTGQWWKLGLAFGGVITGGALMFGGLSVLASTQIAVFAVFSGIFLGMSSFIYACSAIRCPSCGARWIWLGVSRNSSGQWLHWLLNQSSCPKCQNVGNG
jgi:hypothetical protein